MDIQLYYGEQPITASNVEVRINPEDQQRALALIERTRKDVREVNDAEEFDVARQAAGQIKAMLDEIELSRKQVKTPFVVLERTIDETARKVSGPVKNEQNRILGLLGTYVARLEAARREQERIKAEEWRLAQEYAERKVREAEAELKAARDETERVRAENQLLQQQLAQSLAADVDELGKDLESSRGLVPGGRVDHTYEFELVDVAATVKAGCWRLVKWTLDILACKDSVKNQVEMLPPDQEPTLPGIKITKRINVSVKAASRISNE